MNAAREQTGQERVDQATREFRRVTRAEYERGDATTWRLHAGWFRRASGLEWAWFTQGASDGSSSEDT